MIETWVFAAAALFSAVVLSYYSGPGWLPHSECPHCCWCTGRRPRGEVYEDRLRSAIPDTVVKFSPGILLAIVGILLFVSYNCRPRAIGGEAWVTDPGCVDLGLVNVFSVTGIVLFSVGVYLLSSSTPTIVEDDYD